jgi:anaerobic selenocysteine-containing dehydrogenase
MRRYGIQDADFVEVVSRAAVTVQPVTEEITRGTCFCCLRGAIRIPAAQPHDQARDPVSRQPELKACAVRLRKVMDFPLEDN